MNTNGQMASKRTTTTARGWRYAAQVAWLVVSVPVLVVLMLAFGTDDESED